MAALMAAARISVSTLLSMSIFATILPHMRYTSMLVVEPMFQKAATIKQNFKPYFQTIQGSVKGRFTDRKTATSPHRTSKS